MILSDVCGHCINWNDADLIAIRCKLIRENNKAKDPLSIFLDKVIYECYIKNNNKLTIKECKKIKGRLNTIIKKWTKSKIKNTVKEFIELLERCINNRRCLYIYRNDKQLKLVV